MSANDGSEKNGNSHIVDSDGEYGALARSTPAGPDATKSDLHLPYPPPVG